MKAMIFAAGLGTRLKPLTDQLPKALIPVSGKPMLQWVIEKLIKAGVDICVINVHHHASQIKSFISKLSYPGVQFHISDESQQLMDTGGGLVKAASLLEGGPFFVYNADVLCDIDLKAMLEMHRKHRPLATLAVSERPSTRQFLWHEGLLAGWENSSTGETVRCSGFDDKDLKKLAFSGIHVVEPLFFSLVGDEGPFPVTEAYLKLASSYAIRCFEHDSRYWADAGTPEKLEKAEALLASYPGKFV